jgi:hypothetical protein
MVGKFKSKVLQTVPGSPSVRATVPEAVAAILGAVPGSTLVWVIEPGSGRVTVSVEPLGLSKKKSSKWD